MKTKKLSKKLSINKKTIANLHNLDLNNVRGGLTNYETCGVGVTCGDTCMCTAPNTFCGCSGGGCDTFYVTCLMC